MSGCAPVLEPPRFSPGSAVRVSDRRVRGHCRTPFYLRGRRGTIVSVAGRFRDPEKLAYHNPGLPAHYLYRVRFTHAALWPEAVGITEDTLVADIFEPWLEPAEVEAGS